MQVDPPFIQPYSIAVWSARSVADAGRSGRSKFPLIFLQYNFSPLEFNQTSSKFSTSKSGFSRLCRCIVLKAFFLRRRMELEDKAKVVASVWAAEFVKFLAALAVLPLEE